LAVLCSRLAAWSCLGTLAKRRPAIPGIGYFGRHPCPRLLPGECHAGAEFMAITFEALVGLLRMETAQWTGPLRTAGSQLNQFATQGAQLFAKVEQAAQKASIVAGATAAAAVMMAREAVNVGASFEQGMAKVQSLIATTSKDLVGDMEKLSAEAKRLGESTAFTATTGCKWASF
jgi:hypothetical protein